MKVKIILTVWFNKKVQYEFRAPGPRTKILSVFLSFNNLYTKYYFYYKPFVNGIIRHFYKTKSILLFARSKKNSCKVKFFQSKPTDLTKSFKKKIHRSIIKARAIHSKPLQKYREL